MTSYFFFLEYLDSVAESLLKIRKRPSQLSDCSIHLGFPLKGGGSSPFKQFQDNNIRRQAIANIVEYLNTHSENETDSLLNDAIRDTREFVKEKFGVKFSEETIEKWYRNRQPVDWKKISDALFDIGLM